MPQHTPTVSVIVPNYNHASYLRQRIESILNQTYTDIELILIDDGSTDDSRTIIQTYANHPAVTIHYNPTNSGSPFPQWDTGLKLARGRYIWIAESDDYADRTFLAETVARLDRHPDAVMVYTGSYMVDADNQPLPTDWDRFTRHTPPETHYDPLTFLRRNMLCNNAVYNASAVLFRAACYTAVTTRYTRFRYCGDWAFWIGIGRQGRIIRLNRKLNYFRRHSRNVSSAAERDGLYFIEGATIISHTIKLLNLGTWQQTLVKGRMLTRLNRAFRNNPQRRQHIATAHPDIYGGGWQARMLYRVSRLFSTHR